VPRVPRIDPSSARQAPAAPGPARAAAAAGGRAEPPPAAMVPSPRLLARPYSGPAAPIQPLVAAVQGTGAKGQGGHIPLCQRRGCTSYVTPGARFCGPACERAVWAPAGGCEICGKPIGPYATRFCSQQCRGASRRVPVQRCRVCGSPTTSREALLCSDACRGIWRQREHSPYAPGFIARVEELTGRGLSRAAVGELLHCGKNVIVGVCRRYQIGKPKPNPVKRQYPAVHKKRAPGAVKAPRSLHWRPAPVVKRARNVPSRAIAVRVALASLRQSEKIRVDTMPGEGCQFPISENPWRVCDQPRVPSSPNATRLSPYCAEHCARCYGKLAAAA
jgi:predicted nucleic acid-binding Zn ribbon protein